MGLGQRPWPQINNKDGFCFRGFNNIVNIIIKISNSCFYLNLCRWLAVCVLAVRAISGQRSLHKVLLVYSFFLFYSVFFVVEAFGCFM